MIMTSEAILALKQKLGRPLIMGHRGAMGHRPENTMVSFERAVALGVEAIELDVHLSADGHLVVIHDETVDHTTNGHGPVSSLTLAELQALDAGGWYDPAYAGAQIPTLETVLTWAQGKVPVVIEFKLAREAESVVRACIALVDRLDAGENITCISFDHHIPLGIKKARPHWRTAVLYVGRLVDPVGMARAAMADGLLPQWAFVTPDLVQAAHDAGLWVGCWAPNTAEELQHATAMGADMIGTNYPDRMHALVATPNT